VQLAIRGGERTGKARLRLPQKINKIKKQEKLLGLIQSGAMWLRNCSHATRETKKESGATLGPHSNRFFPSSLTDLNGN